MNIEQSYLEFVEAFKKKDLQTVLFYLDHSKASSMLLGLQLLQGEEIKDYYQSTFENLTSVDHLKVSNIQVSMLSNSSAILHCNFSERLTTIDSIKLYYEGAAMYYFEKRGKTWKIIHSTGTVKCP